VVGTGDGAYDVAISGGGGITESVRQIHGNTTTGQRDSFAVYVTLPALKFQSISPVSVSIYTLQLSGAGSSPIFLPAGTVTTISTGDKTATSMMDCKVSLTL
jgi:hypothetical protein